MHILYYDIVYLMGFLKMINFSVVLRDLAIRAGYFYVVKRTEISYLLIHTYIFTRPANYMLNHCFS